MRTDDQRIAAAMADVREWEARDAASVPEPATPSDTEALLRETIAKEHALPAPLAPFLTGSTEAEMAAQAASLASFLKADEPAREPVTLTPGHSPADPASFDAEAVVRAVKDHR